MEEELEIIKLVMDVQHTGNIVFNKLSNGFKDALIRSIFKIKEK